MVREFYANLKEQVLMKVWVRNTWVPFDRAIIKKFYHLLMVDDKAFQKLSETPNYEEIIKCLTNNQAQ